MTSFYCDWAPSFTDFTDNLSCLYTLRCVNLLFYRYLTRIISGNFKMYASKGSEIKIMYFVVAMRFKINHDGVNCKRSIQYRNSNLVIMRLISQFFVKTYYNGNDVFKTYNNTA